MKKLGSFLAQQTTDLIAKENLTLYNNTRLMNISLFRHYITIQIETFFTLLLLLLFPSFFSWLNAHNSCVCVWPSATYWKKSRRIYLLVPKPSVIGEGGGRKERIESYSIYFVRFLVGVSPSFFSSFLVHIDYVGKNTIRPSGIKREREREFCLLH